MQNLKIYRPVKTNFLVQRFGQNLSCAKTDNEGEPITPFQIISKNGLVCPIGYTDFYKAIGMNGHNGDDWMTWHGEPIYFNVDCPGMKWYAKTEVDSSGGVGLRVFGIDPIPFKYEELPPQKTPLIEQYFNGNFTQDNPAGTLRVQFLYWHLKDVFLQDKPKIQVGIFSDGRPQMLPEIKFGDLIGFADSTGASSGDHLHHSMKFCNKASMTIGNDNGYAGAVDMSRWFENLFVGNIIEVQKKAMSAIDYARQIISLVQIYLQSLKK